MTDKLYVPGLSVPGLYVPGLSVPGLYVPGLSVPGLSVPRLSVPGLSVPESSVWDNCKFIQVDDSTLRQQYASSIPREHECEWGDDFENNKETYFLLYKGHAIGSVIFYKDFKLDNINYYYISIRCSWGDKNKHHKKDYSWGRVLWTYILYTINYLEKNKEFIIFNHAIKTAVPYHKKMGMQFINDGNLDRTIDLDRLKKKLDQHKRKHFYSNKEDNKYIDKVVTELLKPKKGEGGYMFYVKRDFYYTNLDTIMNSLLQNRKKRELNNNNHRNNSGAAAAKTRRNNSGAAAAKTRRNNSGAAAAKTSRNNSGAAAAKTSRNNSGNNSKRVKTT
jgi:hypothetical protein